VADDLLPLQQMAQRRSLPTHTRSAPVPALTPRPSPRDASVAVGLEGKFFEVSKSGLNERCDPPREGLYWLA
jgi:hypothetical protein